MISFSRLRHSFLSPVNSANASYDDGTKQTAQSKAEISISFS